MATKLLMPGARLADRTGIENVKIDSIFPEDGLGALFLADMSHPVNPVEDMPTHLGTIPNIAYPHAAVLLGAGTEATLAADVWLSGLTGLDGFAELTERNGLHGCISPTRTFADGVGGLNVALPQLIFDYTRANATHEYFLSLWFRTTRAVAGTPGTVWQAKIGTDTSQYNLAAFNVNAGGSNSTGVSHGASAIDITTGGPRLRNIAGVPAVGYGSDGIDAAYSPGSRSVFIVGNRNKVNSGGTGGSKRGKAGSYIFYRAYLEDLTVSERSYATVHAIDLRLFQRAFGPGGRYADDEWTDTATVA